jgi:hypothetical protein
MINAKERSSPSSAGVPGDSEKCSIHAGVALTGDDVTLGPASKASMRSKGNEMSVTLEDGNAGELMTAHAF